MEEFHSAPTTTMGLNDKLIIAQHNKRSNKGILKSYATYLKPTTDMSEEFKLKYHPKNELVKSQ